MNRTVFNAGGSVIWSQAGYIKSTYCTTLVDLDQDGSLEVLAGDQALRADGSVYWGFSGAYRTRHAIVDFDLDGLPEVLKTHPLAIREFDGTLRCSVGFGGGYPAVADVDGDGDAEIVVCANEAFVQGVKGIRVLYDPATQWADTRPIFNQRSYHITNVNDDGTIPVVERHSWTTYNNYGSQITKPLGVSSTGPGCASQSTALQPELSNTPGSGPWIGTTLQLVANDLPAQGSLSPFGFLIVDFVDPNLPLFVFGRPECIAHAGLAQIIAAPNVGNSATWPIVIPNDPSLRGASMFAQAAAFESTAGPGQSLIDALSNGVLCTICGA